MLLILDDSIKSLDIQNDINACSAIENLLSTVFTGSHLLMATPGVLDFLYAEKNCFGLRSRAVLLEIRNKLPQYGSLLTTIQTRVNICSNIINPIRISQNEWNVPLQDFIDSATINKTLVLAEDSIDAEIYLFAAHHYRIVSGIKGVNIAGRADGGGGSRISKKFGLIAKSKSDLCYCLTDSDKFSPMAIPKHTSRACDKFSTINNWVVKHRASSSRELENLVPRNMLRYSLEKFSVHQLPQWDEILQKSQVQNTLSAYVDLKEGTRLKWILNLTPASQDRKYWISTISKLGLFAQDAECFEQGHCARDKESCNCFVTPGLGQNLAESVLDWLKLSSPHKSCETVDETTDQEWMEIGMEVFEWCCAWKPMRC